MNLSGTTWVTMGGLAEIDFLGSGYTFSVSGKLVESGDYSVKDKAITCTVVSLGPRAGNSEIGDENVLEIVDEKTLYSDDPINGEYYWMRASRKSPMA